MDHFPANHNWLPEGNGWLSTVVNPNQSINDCHLGMVHTCSYHLLMFMLGLVHYYWVYQISHHVYYLCDDIYIYIHIMIIYRLFHLWVSCITLNAEWWASHIIEPGDRIGQKYWAKTNISAWGKEHPPNPPAFCIDSTLNATNSSA